MISVIIPTWNRERKITKAIFSVLNQSYQDLEVLVCDDGSTDNTRHIVEEISKKDNRVKWVSGHHSEGPAVPRNTGLRVARGEWIAYLDSDDIWFPNKLERQLKVADQGGLDLICTNANRIAENRNLYFPKSVESGEISYESILGDNKIICSSVLVKRTAMLSVGGFPEEKEYIAIEDHLAWLKLLSRYRATYISTPQLEYRDNPTETIRSKWRDEYSQKDATSNFMVKWLISNPNFSTAYVGAIISTLSLRVSLNL